MMQVGDSWEDQKISRARGSSQGEVHNTVAALRIVTNLQDEDGKQHFAELSDGSGTRIAEAWGEVD